MRLIYEPKIVEAWWTASNHVGDDLEVYTGIPFDKLHEPHDGDSIPEIAGRVCYQSFTKPRPGGNKAYLERILSEGHGSVLEHASIGFIIHGVSRSLTHELIRHKAGTAVSELSQRFVDASNLGFVVPPRWIVDGSKGVPDPWYASVSVAFNVYQELVIEAIKYELPTLVRKRIREAARSVLPNCVETHIAFTANLRAWRNILEQRGNIHADLEIRRLAVALLPRLVEYAPNVFQDFEVFTDEDGYQSVRNKWRKV